MPVLLLAETHLWSIVSLLFFFALFLGILVWIVVVGRTGRWRRDARMPLDDVHPVEPRTSDDSPHS